MLIAKLILFNGVFIAGFLLLLPESPWLFALTTVLTILFAVMQLRRDNAQQHKILQTLHDGLLNLQDGDFSISLALPKPTTSGQTVPVRHQQLIQLFNGVTDKLREEKQTLYQRELLLDKVVNASDVVTVLVSQRDQIVFANRAAQQFFNRSALLGQPWLSVLQQQAVELIAHNDKSHAIIQLVNRQHPSEPSQNTAAMEQSWHLSRYQLKLHGAHHQLVLLKPLTRELQQQELYTWKKVIRVINHELNNSIAPISSMCHSGRVIADRLNEPQLDRVFNMISGRINKLSDFIQHYSELARLSTPQKQPFDIVATVMQLQSLYGLELSTPQPEIMLNADASQIEQLLINLFKNAKEAAPTQPIWVALQLHGDQLTIAIRDGGSGMSQGVMEKAYLPYFSTKTDGSGIGLTLCREIIDAHQGNMTLSNHPDGGLQVLLQLETGS